ncbi:MAG: ABC transporter ATP-binding protein [Arenicellales bacterium]|jgi:oligopeptide/dipeptide ABC transporter ATP-binding protein|nr:ABC transporter ATP-binding protein [Arenicellales bacterium]MDP7616576.1 ABC transporter ATP-binding protein [Arenicellales bacterium]HJL51351.1 ABC transporter ATP-binding protein [Arenicellales bacterium]|tara:strand:- start:1193 stop:2242 length:1050 start_codon:yes stop_codon:yes gene_type:complete
MDNSTAGAARTDSPVLQIKDLRTFFDTRDGTVRAVNGVSLEVYAGETLCIVGESGCGKSVTAMTILGLLPKPPARIESGEILFQGTDLLKLEEQDMQAIRGNEISMIFQEPMTSLNPVLTIGRQISEVISLHQGVSDRVARDRAIEMLDRVRVPDAHQRVTEYPHQLSGGMRQRAMIAMALSCNPKILIADEPSTALDVTIQAQILDLMRELRDDFGTSIILITHDLGVVAEMGERVLVMYAGRKVEEASVEELFHYPLHPYSEGLMTSIPRLNESLAEDGDRVRLQEIPGMVPSLIEEIPGCLFAPRCSYASEQCVAESPRLAEHRKQHHAACWESGNFANRLESSTP